MLLYKGQKLITLYPSIKLVSESPSTHASMGQTFNFNHSLAYRSLVQKGRPSPNCVKNIIAKAININKGITKTAVSD